MFRYAGHASRRDGKPPDTESTCAGRLADVRARIKTTAKSTAWEKALGHEGHREAYGAENGIDKIQNHPYSKATSLCQSADHEKRNGHTEQNDKISVKL